MHFKKHGPGDDGKSGAHRGVESFQVPNLADAAESLGQADDLVAFRERRCQWFLDEHVDARLHQLPGGGEVVDGGHRDRCRLDLAVRRNKLLDRTEAAAAEFTPHRVSPCRIRVHHADQPHRHALLGKLVVDPGVVAAKRAHANHGDVNDVVSGQFSIPVGRCLTTLLI
jgi:hypothetical protein